MRLEEEPEIAPAPVISAEDLELLAKQKQLYQEHKDLADEALTQARVVDGARAEWKGLDTKSEIAEDASFEHAPFSPQFVANTVKSFGYEVAAAAVGAESTHLDRKLQGTEEKQAENLAKSGQFYKDNADQLSDVAKAEMERDIDSREQHSL